MNVSKTKYKHGKGLKIISLCTNWFLVVCLEKIILPPIGNGIDFLIRNLGSFFLSLIMTAIMVHFLPRKTLMATIILIWIGIILLALN